MTSIILNPTLSPFYNEYEQNKKKAVGKFALSARGYGPLTSEHPKTVCIYYFCSVQECTITACEIR